MAQMNLSTEKKLMDLDNRLIVAKEKGAGGQWTGNLGFIDANYCIWNSNGALLYSTGNYF